MHFTPLNWNLEKRKHILTFIYEVSYSRFSISKFWFRSVSGFRLKKLQRKAGCYKKPWSTVTHYDWVYLPYEFFVGQRGATSICETEVRLFWTRTADVSVPNRPNGTTARRLNNNGEHVAHQSSSSSSSQKHLHDKRRFYRDASCLSQDSKFADVMWGFYALSLILYLNKHGYLRIFFVCIRSVASNSFFFLFL